MALIRCPECGREVSDQATICPNCGYGIKEHRKQHHSKKREFEGEGNYRKTNGLGKRGNKLVWIIPVSLLLVAVILIGVIVVIQNFGKQEQDPDYNQKKKYQEANDFLEKGDYVQARERFLELEDYSDAAERAEEAHNCYLEDLYNKAIMAENDKKYQEASQIFEQLSKENYKDSSAKAEEASGHIYREETKIEYLEMGCGHGDPYLYCCDRTITTTVKAKITIEYKNDAPNLNNVTIEYYDPVWGGRAFGWNLKHIKLVGSFPKIEENNIYGSGQLYVYNGKEYELVYVGGFKDGKYEGKGKFYWGEDSGGGVLLDATFENGNPVKYTRYYQDGTQNDTGTITKNGMEKSSKFGESDNYDEEVFNKFDQSTKDRLMKAQEMSIY